MIICNIQWFLPCGLQQDTNKGSQSVFKVNMLLSAFYKTHFLTWMLWFSLSGRGPGELPLNSAQKRTSIWTVLIIIIIFFLMGNSHKEFVEFVNRRSFEPEFAEAPSPA